MVGLMTREQLDTLIAKHTEICRTCRIDTRGRRCEWPEGARAVFNALVVLADEAYDQAGIALYGAEAWAAKRAEV